MVAKAPTGPGSVKCRVAIVLGIVIGGAAVAAGFGALAAGIGFLEGGPADSLLEAAIGTIAGFVSGAIVSGFQGAVIGGCFDDPERRVN